MTLERFIERLKHWTATAPHKGWWHLTEGELRSKCIRCPITFVARFEADKGFPMSAYDDAADAMGMDIHLADRIVWAADYAPEPEPNPNYDPALRKQLLDACGVKERG